MSDGRTGPVGSEGGADGGSLVATVMCESVPELTVETFTRAWETVWPALPCPTNMTHQAIGPNGLTSLHLDLDGRKAAVGVLPFPVSDVDAAPCEHWLWPEAAEVIGRSKAHVIVCGPNVDPPDPLRLHWYVTHLVAATIDATDALGVAWGRFGPAVRADLFKAMAQDLASHGNPALWLWIDLPAYVEHGKATVITEGLSQFGLMEIEISDSAQAVGELRELATNVAEYLIDHGPVLADGDTLGPTATPLFAVRHGPSLLDRPGPVYRIEKLTGS